MKPGKDNVIEVDYQTAKELIRAASARIDALYEERYYVWKSHVKAEYLACVKAGKINTQCTEAIDSNIDALNAAIIKLTEVVDRYERDDGFAVIDIMEETDNETCENS